MSLLVDWPYLPLILTEPVYILPEPQNAPPKVVPVAEKPALQISPSPRLPEPQPAPPPRKSTKKVAIFYNEQTTPYLQPKHEALLVNILKAINLTLDDVDLLNLHNIKQIDYAEMLREKTTHYFISFGIDLRELQINIPLVAYQMTEVEGIKMLLADSFHELELNLDKKRLLWACLKKMFL